MTRTTSKTFLALGLGIAALSAAAGCTRGGDLGRGARTTTTSARTPRPDATVASTRTIDNAGFVDNGGRTSDMTSRSELSGMRATESGSERPTGTPGSGFPLPLDVKTQSRQVGEGAGAASSVRGTDARPTSGSPVDEAVGRIARARCDRETTCERIGRGRAFPTQDACMTEHRTMARQETTQASCARGIDSTQLASCLQALRSQACNAGASELDNVPACRVSALCAP